MSFRPKQSPSTSSGQAEGDIQRYTNVVDLWLDSRFRGNDGCVIARLVRAIQ
jgi:hypothetical protein